ncbi:MAG: DUF4833 domain-containing protein [Lentimicrobium sp.]|nr:DUF4833 domain-containing protein [Lentimicrobium sp.]
MKNTWKHSLLLLIIGLLFAGFTMPSSDVILFKIARSKDANEIFYMVNTLKNNKLDSNNPIAVQWIKRSSVIKTEPLTRIQQKFAYGLKFLSVDEQKAVFQFVSYNKRDFHLKKNNKGKYAVFTKLEKEEVEVDRIFIQIDGGSFWVPKISRVELHAISKADNKPLIEVIIP